MSIVTEIETLFENLRGKVGGFTSDAELHFTNFLHLAKAEEAAADAREAAAAAPAPATRQKAQGAARTPRS